MSTKKELLIMEFLARGLYFIQKSLEDPRKAFKEYVEFLEDMLQKITGKQVKIEYTIRIEGEGDE